MKKCLGLIMLLLSLCCSIPIHAQTISSNTGTPAKKKGMSLKQYKTLIKSDQWVLVDFFADWCGPCKRMDPTLEEIKKEMGEKLKLIRINADDNTDVCNELSVYTLPTLFLYKNGTMYWFNSGYVDKAEIMSHIR